MIYPFTLEIFTKVKYKPIVQRRDLGYNRVVALGSTGFES